MNLPWDIVARAVVDGVAVRRGDRVAISLTGVESYAAALAVVRECHQRGAHPQVVLAADDFDRDALASAPLDLLATPGPLELAAVAWADAYVALRPMTPPPSVAGPVDTHRIAAQRLGKGGVSAARWSVDRWVVVRIPTTEWAQYVDVDAEVIGREFMAGVTTDWAAHRPHWQELAASLTSCSQVEIVDADTHLVLPTTGRTWVVFDGAANLPDGEIATAPVDDGTYGHLTIPGSFSFADTRFTNLRLRFEAGRCVDVRADEGEELARALLAADGGSDRIGELGIGVNPGVRTPVGDLFIDEKILGTVHIALGRAYPQCGGTNSSSIHWDIVKDLRGAGGRLTADDLVLISNGVPQPPLLRADHRPSHASDRSLS
ncbi:MAG: aminopeptidase [Lapillicoccus sp.]